MRCLCCYLFSIISVFTIHVENTRAEQSQSFAQGVVFHDQNQNRQFDAGEKLLHGIRVSNGKEITKTDQQGRYKLPVSEDAIIFVIKPRNWQTPINEQMLPRFYYIHKPNGSVKSKYPGVAPTGPLPASIDFPLYPKQEPDDFKAIMFGDPQPRNLQEVDWISHDVVDQLLGSDASLGGTL